MAIRMEEKPRYTEHKDFTESPARVSPASSLESRLVLPNRSKTVDEGPQNTGVVRLLPDPVPGPIRRHTTVIPAQEPTRRLGKSARSNRSFSTTLGVNSRPFFISPFPKSIKSIKSIKSNGAKKTSGDQVQVQAAHIEKRNTNITTNSDATEAELEHELRMDEKRRRQEFPRRLVTSFVGGIFVIAPMVIMSIDGSLIKSLITSSVAVLLFGLVLAWGSTSDEISLFVATAGYAAFLAVFVAVGDEKAIKDVFNPQGGI